MNASSSNTNQRRWAIPLAALSLALLVGVVGWRLGREPKVEVAEREREREPVQAVVAAAASVSIWHPPPPRPSSAAEGKRKPAPLEYMSDGIPIMPVSNDDPHDFYAHPHPITPAHQRIYRENSLLYQLNEAMDGRESLRLRALLAMYRQEYPEDPNEMQAGYELIADCLDSPSDEVHARARRFFQEEVASTLRRFVLRHCLDGRP